ncbi:hypothetical protein [Microcystis sp. LE19-195.1E]|nr:hypothetical protein [Microcystis sp. LE19-195.1E]
MGKTYTPHPTPHTLAPPTNFFSKPYLSRDLRYLTRNNSEIL